MMNADLIPTIFVLSLLFCLSTSSPLTFDPLKALSSTGSIPSIFLNQDLISLRAAVSLCQYGKCSWDVIEGNFQILDFILPSSPRNTDVNAITFERIEWNYTSIKVNGALNTLIDLNLGGPTITIILSKNSTNFSDLASQGFPPSLSSSSSSSTTTSSSSSFLINSLTFSGSPPKITILTPLSSTPLTTYTLPPSTLTSISSLITSPLSPSEFYSLLKSSLMKTVKTRTRNNIIKIVKDELSQGSNDVNLISDLSIKTRNVMEGIKDNIKKTIEEEIDIIIPEEFKRKRGSFKEELESFREFFKGGDNDDDDDDDGEYISLLIKALEMHEG
ncbi:hypothetical protein TrST_g12429 [Triparma strigata]|uniref:Uncharacterized protein n=1 Tax=Triparma strigata TaxID=1606541 RepID=A0A9W7AJE3_9STRA|nr:hypothetical protein TrST_g12429 [Triparma strigata]